jgi:hypothetical protein
MIVRISVCPQATHILGLTSNPIVSLKANAAYRMIQIATKTGTAAAVFNVEA